MPVSKAQARATAKYEQENYDKVLLRLPKGTKDRIKATGNTVNGFIVKAVLERLAADRDPEELDSLPPLEWSVHGMLTCWRIDKTARKAVFR